MAQREVDNTVLSWRTYERVVEFLIDNDPDQVVSFSEAEVWQILDNMEGVGVNGETLTATSDCVPSILPDRIPKIENPLESSPKMDANKYMFKHVDNLGELEVKGAGKETQATRTNVKTNNENHVKVAPEADPTQTEETQVTKTNVKTNNENQVKVAPEIDPTQTEETEIGIYTGISNDRHIGVIPEVNIANNADHSRPKESIWQHVVEVKPTPAVPKAKLELLGDFTTGEITCTEVNEAANEEKRPFLVFATVKQRLEVVNLLGNKHVKDLMLVSVNNTEQEEEDAHKRPVMDVKEEEMKQENGIRVEGNIENGNRSNEYTEEEEVQAWEVIRSRARLMMRKKQTYEDLLRQNEKEANPL